jgi:hypothetical protein
VKPRGTAVLLAVLTLLIAGYWAMLRFEVKEQERIEIAKKLFTFSPEEITAITVQLSDEKPTVGVRNADGTWSVEEPIKTIGSKTVWDRVAAAVADLSNERTIDAEGKDLADYGLDKPRVLVTATRKSGEPIVLKFGNAEPTQEKRFVLLQDNTLILTRNSAFNEVNRPLTDLRDNFLVRARNVAQNIHRVEFIRVKEKPEGAPDDPNAPPELRNGQLQSTVLLEKDSAGIWQMLEPEKCLANQDAASALVIALLTSAGTDYVENPGSLKDYGLDPAGACVRAFLDGEKEPQTVFFGGSIKKTKDSREQIYAKRANSSEVFLVDDYVRQTMPSTPLAFRERRLVTRGMSDLVKLEYAMPDRRFVFELDKEKGWHVTEPVMQDYDQSEISSFISVLAGVTGQHFPGIDSPQFELDKPTLRIALRYLQGEPNEEIVVGAVTEDGTGRYAKQDIGVVTTIPLANYNQLVRTAWDFRNRDLFTFDKLTATKIDVTLDGTTYAFSKRDGLWHVDQPESMRFDNQGDAALLIETAANATAATLESETIPVDLAAFGLDAPVATLRISANSVQGDSVVIGPLSIGAAAPDNDQERFASMSGRSEIYRIDQKVVTDIREALKGVVKK